MTSITSLLNLSALTNDELHALQGAVDTELSNRYSADGTSRDAYGNIRLGETTDWGALPTTPEWQQSESDSGIDETPEDVACTEEAVHYETTNEKPAPEVTTEQVQVPSEDGSYVSQVTVHYNHDCEPKPAPEKMGDIKRETCDMLGVHGTKALKADLRSRGLSHLLEGRNLRTKAAWCLIHREVQFYL